jgi:hypothetical protein
MTDGDRRQTARSLARLQGLIDQMDALGRDAEDAAARLTQVLGGRINVALHPEQQQLLTAIGDVIEIVTERSRLAHEAHRLISELRRREGEGWKAVSDPVPNT